MHYRDVSYQFGETIDVLIGDIVHDASVFHIAISKIVIALAFLLLFKTE